MRISAKADYAVRAAVELAAAPAGKAVPAERIATSQGIPLNFLEHILSELRVAGGKPEEAEYPGVASELPRVWIAVRKNLRNVVEHVSVADIAGAHLPDSINLLADDPEAWVTR